MRVDVVLRGMDVAAMSDCARVADQLVAPPTLWLPESPGDRNPFVTAAALLARTERVRIGTGVVPIPLRATIDLLAGALTVSETFPGRLDLGVGSGNVMSLARAGVAVTGSPLTVVREFLAAVADLGDRAGVTGLLDFPTPAVVPPVYLAAHNQRMISTAVRQSDGVILNLVPESDLAGTIDFVRTVADRHARTPRIGMFQLTALGEPVAAVAAARRVLAGFLRSPAVRTRLAAFGSRHTGLADRLAGMPAGLDDAALAEAIPDSVVADFGPTTVESLAARLRMAADAGLDFVALSVFPVPLLLRKAFPPVPTQSAARQATIEAIGLLADVVPTPARSVP